MNNGDTIFSDTLDAGYDANSFEAEGTALKRGAWAIVRYLKDMGISDKKICIFSDCQSWVAKINRMNPIDDVDVDMFS